MNLRNHGSNPGHAHVGNQPIASPKIDKRPKTRTSLVILVGLVGGFLQIIAHDLVPSDMSDSLAIVFG